MRGGRLIFPVLAEIQPFQGAPAQDPDFQEPALDCADEPSQPYRLPCQVEPDETQMLNMHPNGNAPRTQVHLVFHERSMRNIRRPGVRDQLRGLYSLRGEALSGYDHAAGLEAVEARPLSFGLNRGQTRANLLRVTFRDRTAGVRSVDR